MTDHFALQNVIFSDEDLSLLDRSAIPNHVAIIMDGNRRWAKNHSLPLIMGHWKGADVLTQITRAASQIGIRTLTVYSFSTENWSRSQEEIDGLMELFEVYLRGERDRMRQEGVCLQTIGDLSRLPSSVQSEIRLTKDATADSKKIDLVLAINYGGRDDIKRAVQRIVEEIEQGKLSKHQISESLINSYLDTALWQDPDLLIRTSGERRQSNFLLWQLSYSEFDYTNVLWPDFTPSDLLTSVCKWQSRAKRLGR